MTHTAAEGTQTPLLYISYHTTCITLLAGTDHYGRAFLWGIKRKIHLLKYGIRISSQIWRRSWTTLKEQFTLKQQQKEGSCNIIAGFWGPWEPDLPWKHIYTLRKLKVKMNKSRGSITPDELLLLLFPSAWWQVYNDFIFVCTVPLKAYSVTTTFYQHASKMHKLGLEVLRSWSAYSLTKRTILWWVTVQLLGPGMKLQYFIGGDWNKSAPLKC